MSSPTWSNKIKESFQSAEESDEDAEVEGFNPFPVPETDGALKDPVSADETILLKGKQPLVKEDKSAEYKENTLSDQFKSLKESPNLAKIASLYKNGVKQMKSQMGSQKDAAMQSVVGVYFEDPDSQEAKQSSKIISRQIAMYLAIPMTYWIVLNWWHTWIYTTSSVDFKNVLNWKIFKVMQFGIEPPIMMLEAINYQILSKRLDKNISDKTRESFRKMWDWRPVTFTLFYFVIFAGMTYSPLFKIFTNVLEGNPGILSSVLTVGSIILYFSYNFTFERFQKYLKIVGVQLFVPIIMIMMFILVLIFSFIASIILTFYLMFYSHIAFFYHNGFNPITMYKKIRQIFQDLQDAPVNIPEPEENDYWTKVKNFIFRNFHNLFMLIMIFIPMLIKNCVEASQKVKSVDLLILIIMINLLLVGLLGFMPMFGIIKYFANLVIKFAFSGKKINKERNLQPIPASEGGTPSSQPLPATTATAPAGSLTTTPTEPLVTTATATAGPLPATPTEPPATTAPATTAP